MRKSFKKRQLGDSDIPVASFSDLAFLLIIFFILTTTFQKATGFLTDIPSGTKSQVAQQEKTTTIALHEDQISLNDGKVSMAELRRRLRNMDLKSKLGDAKIVILTATGKVKYQTYYETMSMITTAGGVIAIIREEGSKDNK